MRTRTPFIMAGGLLLVLFTAGSAGAVLPYGNTPNPEGIYFTDYPTVYTAGTLKGDDGETVVDDLDLTSVVNLFRITWYKRWLFGRTWAWSLIVPAVRNEILGHRDTGIGDFICAGGFWIMENREKRTGLASVLYLHIPVGDYDSKNPASVGSDVWTIEPALLYSSVFGRFGLEATLKYAIQTENDQTDEREGDLLSLETYTGYSLRPNLLIGVHANAAFGSDDERAGVDVPGSAVRRFSAGPSVYWRPADPSRRPAIPSIVASYMADVECENTTQGHKVQLRLSWKIR